MKKLLSLLFLLNLSLLGQNKIAFDFDYALFRYDSVKTYLEVYYSIAQNSLTINEENELGAFLKIKITDKNSDKVLINKRYLTKTSIVGNDSSYLYKNLLGNISYVLNPSNYLLNISAVDINDTNNVQKFEESVTAKSFDNNSYALSDIQLATRIVSGSNNKNSIFYKNTMEVYPNPRDLYSEQMPVLFYYSELYNLDNPKYSEKNLTLIQQLNDAYGNPIKSKKKNLNKNNNSVVEAGVINLKTYPTGTYTLVLSIFEDSVEIGKSSSKRFYLINPSVKQEKKVLSNNMDVQSSEYGILSEEECDEQFEIAKAIATGKDEEAYGNITSLEGKREFLFNFWKVRDQIPATSKNEFKEEYLERVEYVERRFKAFGKRGIHTDRGRIYLLYGEPDEIDNYPSEYNMKPYSIWSYHSIEGGVVFIFGDVTGYNNYELLHSTKRGELYDDSWQRRVSVN